MKIGKYKLELTCSACPEQYDVFDGDKTVGYLRLRHGHFSASAPYCGGETVYSAGTRGDGMFADSQERRRHLSAAIVAIDEFLQKEEVLEYEE